MKKYIKITLTILSVVFLTKCSDQLERFPLDSLVEETAFQTTADLEAGLRSVIDGYNVASPIVFNEIFSDNAIRGEFNGGQNQNLFGQILTPNNGDVGIWTDRYNTLNRINRLLAAAATISPDAADAVLYNDVLGMAHALRGYVHSELLFYYGLDITNASALGVPIQEVVATSGEAERNTTGEVLAFVESEFVLAQSLISSTDISFPSDDMIDFQRARIALYTENFDAVIPLANRIIAKYPLANETEYELMFANDQNETEIIWRRDNTLASNSNIAGNFTFTASQNNQTAVSNGLFDELIADNSVRLAVNIAADGSFGSDFSAKPQPWYVPNKYPANGDNLYINDQKLMRVSEMYLIRAEAYARQSSSNFALASADINAIRTARGSQLPAANYSDIVGAATDIKRERRLELAFEGHRYLDIKRLKGVLNEGVVRDPRDCGGATPCNITVSSEKFIFPIPQGEINGNTLISQAPGY
jgi:hypothetical protein